MRLAEASGGIGEGVGDETSRLVLPALPAPALLIPIIVSFAALASLALLPHDVFLDAIWMRAGIVAVLAITALAVFVRWRSLLNTIPTETGAWQGFIDNVPFGVACWDDERRLVASNGTYRDALSLEAEDCRDGTPFSAFVEKLKSLGELRLAGEKNGLRRLEMRSSTGRWLNIDERPLPDGGFLTIVTDVSRIKEANLRLSSIQKDQRQLAQRFQEEKLKAEAASRSKTAFLAHLSHDIRTPLNHIIGFTDLIRHQTYGPLGDARYMGYVDHIKGAGENLLASFDEILELAELETGKRQMQEEPLEVTDVLESICERFRQQARQKRVKLTVSEPARARLVGDPLGLQRMIGNLVENAIRFTPAGGIVCLTSWRAEDGVVIEVSDTGIGMSPEKLAGLREPFVLGDAAFTRDHDGVGLGIAISRTIAELSGGEIAIESSPNIGTTVAISLPLPRTKRVVTEHAA